MRRGIVARPRLITRLLALDEPMVAVLAPPGYGKSTLLAQWADAADRPVAWFSCDAQDNDVATLLGGIAASVDRAVGLDPAVLDAVAIPGPSVWSSAVPRLSAALAGAPPMTIVIDDLDRIDNDEALDAIVAIGDHLSAGSCLALAGRSLETFPIAYLASRGRLATLDRDHLALDLDETRDMVRAAGLRWSDEQVETLHRETEGWPAGIYLTILAARDGGHAGPEATAVPPGSPERLIEDYLRTEVLAMMRREDVELLVAVSHLDRFNGSLADRILDRRGTYADLDRLERENAFLIALDPDRTWFRVHRLLATLLRSESARRDPAARRRILHAAAAWHEAVGMPEQALEYAMAGEDEPTAARLLTVLAQPALNAGRSETARRWFAWFEGRDGRTRYPTLAAQATMLFAVAGDAGSSDRWLAILADDGDDGAADHVTGVAAIARAMRMGEGVTGLIADARIAVGCTDDDGPWRVAALASDGLARWLSGDAAGAEVALQRAVGRYERGPGAHAAAIFALVHLAVIAIEGGDWPAATAHAGLARRIALASGLVEGAPGAGIDAVHARIAVHRGATEQARTDAMHARRLRGLLTDAIPWFAIRVRLDLIRVDLALGDGGGARTLLSEVRELLGDHPDMGTLAEEAAEVGRMVQAHRGGEAGASTLTLAELRLLPFLTTHLSFREIGQRLFVSQNTVKSQAISIYRKLDATSRSEAIEHAVQMGLLDGAVGTPTTSA